MPTSLLPMVPVSVMGMPEKPCRILASNTSPTVCEGLSTTGSVMKPCSNFCGERWGRRRLEEGWRRHTAKPQGSLGSQRGERAMGKRGLGPMSPVWGRADKTPRQSARGCTSLQGWQRRGRLGHIFFQGTGLVLALTFRTSLAWNSGVQLW